jgi:hypothetical protein
MSDDGRNRAVGGGKVFRNDLSVLSWPDTLTNATDVSKAIIVIELEHSKIHQGKGWEISIEAGTIGAGASFNVLYKINEGRPHLRNYSVTVSDGPVTVRLFEAPTVTANGTEVSPRNRNRAESDINGVQVFTGPTITADGTRLETTFLPALGNKVGGNVDSAYEEWILNEEYYLLRITNGSNSSITAVINAFWYVF